MKEYELHLYLAYLGLSTCAHILMVVIFCLAVSFDHRFHAGSQKPFFSLELENNLAYDGTVTITTMADLAAAKNFISAYLTYCGKSSSQQNIPDAMQFAKALPRLIVRPSLERE